MPMMSTSNSLIEAGAARPLPSGEAIMASTRKAPPPHPGAIVADVLDTGRISMRQAAAAIGMSPTGLNKVLRGESPVTAATALKLAAFLGGSAELYMRLQAEYDLWHERRRLAGELAAIRPAADMAA